MHPNVHFTYDVASGMQMSLPKYAQSQTTCPELTVSSTRESRSLVGAEEGGGVGPHWVRQSFQEEVVLGVGSRRIGCVCKKNVASRERGRSRGQGPGEQQQQRQEQKVREALVTMGSLAPLRQGFEERSSDFTREVESVLVKGNSLEETLLTLCVSCIQISNTEKKKKKKSRHRVSNSE